MVSESEAQVCVLRVKVGYFLIKLLLRAITAVMFCAGKSFCSFPKTQEKGAVYEQYIIVALLGAP